MSNYNYSLLKFDFMLSKHPSNNFSAYEINQMLNSITESNDEKTKCLEFFVSEGILQQNKHMYYYMLNKTPYMGVYKNLPIIRSKIDNMILKTLDLSNLNI